MSKDKDIEEKVHRDRNLAIYFEIQDSNNYSNSPVPLLIFKNSNYKLSRDEIMRATLRPCNLTLDDKMTYVKSNTEEAYMNRDGINMLKVNYCRLDHKC